jgi:arylformamidase
MKIYDISQGVFASEVYPGDPVPRKDRVFSMERGDLYNLTAFYMCAHNGTHIDAPSHFIKDGDGVDEIPLEKTVGMVFVAENPGIVGKEEAEKIIARGLSTAPESVTRVLIKGGEISYEGAKAFMESGVVLLGNEGQTVGPADAPMATHKLLLGAGVVILEGVRLQQVPEGVYFLCAAPIKLEGCDGAPTRAILIER